MPFSTSSFAAARPKARGSSSAWAPRVQSVAQPPRPPESLPGARFPGQTVSKQKQVGALNAPQPTAPPPGSPQGYGQPQAAPQIPPGAQPPMQTVAPVDWNLIRGAGDLMVAPPQAAQQPAMPAAPIPEQVWTAAPTQGAPAQAPAAPAGGAVQMPTGGIVPLTGTGGPAPGYDPYGGPQEQMGQGQQRKAQDQANLLGPLGDVVGVGKRGPMSPQDWAMAQNNLNYQNTLKAEADRQAGLDELARGYGNVGLSPEQQAVKEMLLGRSQEGPFDAAYMEQQRGAMGDRAALDLQNQQESAGAEFARRGLGGGLSEYQKAMLQQQASTGLQGQFAGMETTARTANEEATRAALGMYQQQASEEAQQRAAYDELAANAYFNTERGPVDFSSMMTKASKKDRKSVV